MTITEKSNGFVEISTDQEHILHRKDTPDEFPEIRHVTINSNMLPLYEEVSADRPALRKAIADKIAEIDAYDTSEAVNSFTMQGQAMWLDKAMRVGLANSTAIQEAAGIETTTLWYGTQCYNLPVASAKAMLATLELYALECYNTTARHKAAVSALEDIEAVKAYDHTAGYPPKPQF